MSGLFEIALPTHLLLLLRYGYHGESCQRMASHYRRSKGRYGPYRPVSNYLPGRSFSR